MKYLRITMPSDNSVWDVPVDVIAKAAANYWAERDPDTTYGIEFDHYMNENSEVLDWAVNNMNWSDISDHAVRVCIDESVDYEQDYTFADMEIVTHENL